MRTTLTDMCEVCGVEPPAHRHHAVKEQTLRKYARDHGYDFEEVRWDLRLRILVCERCHSLHTLATERMPYSILRPETIAFAEELRLGWSLDREYPVEAA
jgi:hypothetical protein